MYYFAYGSNMLQRRLTERIGSVALTGTGALAGYQLRFHKRSRDGSGKCNLYFTGHGRDVARGVIYSLRRDQRIRLDEHEGHGYQPRPVLVHTGLRRIRALTYIAPADFLDEALRPYDWYLDFVIAGARQHGLEQYYVDALGRVSPVTDRDRQRAAFNARLLRLTWL